MRLFLHQLQHFLLLLLFGLAHAFVELMNDLAIVLTECLLKVAGCLYHKQLILTLLLLCGTTLVSISLLHIGKLLLVTQVGEALKAVHLLDELSVCLIIVLRVQLLWFLSLVITTQPLRRILRYLLEWFVRFLLLLWNLWMAVYSHGYLSRLPHELSQHV